MNGPLTLIEWAAAAAAALVLLGFGIGLAVIIIKTAAEAVGKDKKP